MGTEINRIAAVDAVYPIEIQSNRFTSISFSGPHGGTATAGTIAIRAKVPGALDFESITGVSDIDLSAPVTQTIENTPIAHLEFTLSGFAGTASELKIAVNTFDFRV